eukprot:7185147-Pyramimonas_sp.AAC.1
MCIRDRSLGISFCVCGQERSVIQDERDDASFLPLIANEHIGVEPDAVEVNLLSVTCTPTGSACDRAAGAARPIAHISLAARQTRDSTVWQR